MAPKIEPNSVSSSLKAIRRIRSGKLSTKYAGVNIAADANEE